MKINQDENFLTRMDYDTFRRQTQDDRIKLFVEKNKKKITNNEQIETFNRLIEDSNRRLEANGRINLNKNQFTTTNKKYNNQEWANIYKQR